MNNIIIYHSFAKQLNRFASIDNKYYEIMELAFGSAKY